MTSLDEIADQYLPDDLKSNQLKVTTKWHISTTLNTEAEVTNVQQHYWVFGQPSEYGDEANANKKGWWKSK